MLQESPQKFWCGKGHGAVVVAVSVVLPSESNLLAIEGEQPMIADGDSVSVASEIAKNRARSAQRRFGVDDPVLAKQGVEEGLKPARIGQRGRLPPEDEKPAAMGPAQSPDEALAKDPAEHLHREEETVPGTDPALMIR